MIRKILPALLICLALPVWAAEDNDDFFLDIGGAYFYGLDSTKDYEPYRIGRGSVSATLSYQLGHLNDDWSYHVGWGTATIMTYDPHLIGNTDKSRTFEGPLVGLRYKVVTGANLFLGHDTSYGGNYLDAGGWTLGINYFVNPDEAWELFNLYVLE